jgi:hypothetical protein
MASRHTVVRFNSPPSPFEYFLLSDGKYYIISQIDKMKYATGVLLISESHTRHLEHISSEWGNWRWCSEKCEVMIHPVKSTLQFSRRHAPYAHSDATLAFKRHIASKLEDIAYG